ncbi:MAG: type I 3-dehydroquinate dehydratase, partial [Spirochaetales bacterium]|nr:type I 3-dehydroquinate dehydratase [Spirochaetales bacterium]
MKPRPCSSPWLCLSLTAETLARDLEVLGKYRALVDAVELRADALRPEELSGLARFPDRAGLPAILTIRRVRDGGSWAGPERERLCCFEAALDGGWAYLDLEEDLEAASLADAARARGVGVIRSFHDPQGVPDNLEERLQALPRHPAELPKAAITPRDTRELLAVVDACLRLARTRKILIAMGERGICTRVLAGALGSALSYCSAPELSPAAPGHLGPQELADLYRFRSLGPGTRVCGVMGSPIAHSRSPEIHNRGYGALGLDAVYLPFLVDPADQIAEFFALADLLGVQGLSVTMPYKQAVIPLLSERDPLVSEIGACNTLVRRGHGDGSGPGG